MEIDGSSLLSVKRAALIDAFLEYEKALIDAAIEIDTQHKKRFSKMQKNAVKKGVSNGENIK